MKYRLRATPAYHRDYKKAIKRGLPVEKLKAVVKKLVNGEALPPKNHDHALSNNWANHRECHIAPDWLLIYQIKEDVLVLELTRTGSHADLF
ncbi:MAG: type II toxin-antitoxin system YafQ family toxin [Kiritimatiellia bacterium]